MRKLLVAALPLLCTLLPAQGAGEPRTLLLSVEGSVTEVGVTGVWKKDFPFARQAIPERPTGWVRVLDARGKLLERVHLDLSHSHLDPNNPDPVVIGDRVFHAGISTFVKIPDLGDRIAALEFVRATEQGEQKLGKVTGTEIRRLAAAARPTGAVTVKTHLNNGPKQNRYDIVVLADGYLAGDLARFYTDVNNWMNNLFSKEPFKTYKGYFNVHSVFRASAERGADQPCKNPPTTRNTVYDATYCYGGTQRCIYIKNTTLATSDAALAPDVENSIAVFVYSAEYGGCGGKFAVSYNGSQAPEVQTHEFGHSYGGLADEYGGNPGKTYSGAEPGQPNVTASSTCNKWSLWKGIQGVGCFQGGRYYDKGIWRPWSSCEMRDLGRPFCPVCREDLTKDGYTTVNSIENPLPSNTTVTLTKPASQIFRFTNLVPASSNPLIRWYVDNSLKQTGGTSYTLASTSLSAGSHKLLLQCWDRTAFVKKGTASLLKTRTWTVDVKDAARPDLVISSISAPAGRVWQAGATQSVSVVTRNAGTATAGPSVTSLHLVTTTTVSRSSYMLWSYSVPSLGPGATHSITLRFTNPRCWYNTSTSYYVGAYADGYAGIAESNESNNGRVITTPRKLAVYGGSGRYIEYTSPTAGNTAGPYWYGGAVWSAPAGLSTRVCAVGPSHLGHYVVFAMSGSSRFTFDPWTDLSLAVPFFLPIILRTSATNGSGFTLQVIPRFKSTSTLTAYVHSFWFSPSFAFVGLGNNSLYNQIRR